MRRLLLLGLVTVTTACAHVPWEHAPCSFIVSPLSLNVSAEGGTLPVTVGASGRLCRWRVSREQDWTGVSPREGTGSGTVTITVRANTTATIRTGRLTVADHLVTVDQGGH